MYIQKFDKKSSALSGGGKAGHQQRKIFTNISQPSIARLWDPTIDVDADWCSRRVRKRNAGILL
jgi:hypothetical protein